MFNVRYLQPTNQFSLHCRRLKVLFVRHMASENSVVRVSQGQLKGVVEEDAYGGRYLAFRGIPFAKPPVGQLRFKDPEPPEPWTGVKEATQYGSDCAQINIFTQTPIGSDDCLYLNVYRPTNESATKRAVMVWIHGGAFVHGSGDSKIYGPDYLVRKDIILVTINYRLGILGFLNLEHEAAPGNQGLKDQVMALKWVQQNIASFGGDPNNVTVFGESAGAASVHYLTVSPLSQGLFQKAIAQSGSASNPWAFISEEPSKHAYRMAAKLGEHSTDPKTVVEFLRTVDAQKLVIAESELITPQDRFVMFGLFGPGIDDKSPNPIIPQHPRQMMKVGIKVPYLTGFNINEGSLILTPFRGPNVEENLRLINQNINIAIPEETKIYMRKEGISPADIKRRYFGKEPVSVKTVQQYANFLSDTMFLQGIHEVINIQQEKGTEPTYFYKFTYDAKESLMKMLFNIPLPGATHADDLMFLFYPYTAKNMGLGPVEVGTDSHKMMEHFTQMWTNFAKTGNPTPNITDVITTIWKPIKQSDTYDYLSINNTLQMESAKKTGQTYDWAELKNKL